MNTPNLIIAGAQKSGTTWLHRALKQHNDIFMSAQKELNFFNRIANYEDASAVEKYLDNFDFSGSHKYVGESTPHYMWVRENCKPFDPNVVPRNTAEFIKKMSPDAKIILVLRNPVTRAISAFHHHFAMGRLTADSQIDNVDAKFGIQDIGHYQRHVNYWKDVFGGNLLVYLYDDLKTDASSFLSKIFTDLGVIDMSKEIGQELASQKINSKQKILSRNTVQSSSSFPAVSAAQIAEMIDLFESDTVFIENFLACKLPQWRDAASIEQAVVYR